MYRNLSYVLVCSAFLMTSRSVCAKEKSYDSLKPYLTASTIAVLEIDAQKFLNHDSILNNLRDISKIYHPLKKDANVKIELEKLYQAGELKTIYAVFDTAYLQHSFPFYVIPCSKGKKQEVRATLQSFNFFLSFKQNLRMSADVLPYQVYEDQYGVFACKQLSRDGKKKWDNFLKSVERDDILKILKNNKTSFCSLAISPTNVQRRIFEEQLPVISGLIPAIPEGILTKGITSISVDLNKELTQSELIVETIDKKTAGKVQSFIKKVYQGLSEGKHSKVGSVLNSHFVPVQEVNKIKLVLDHESSSGKFIRKAVESVNDQLASTFQRKITMNRLKRIGLAMHNYHDVHSSFPARAILSKEGKPLLSWRVAILPFIEAGDLYKKFHLDEPWDSEHNKKLIPLMPKAYFSPASDVNYDFKTTFLGLAGKNMIMGSSKAVKIREMIDGTSNTTIVVDTNDENAVIWSKPKDIIPGKNPVEDLVGHFPDGFYGLWADGSARLLLKQYQPELIHKAFTYSGKELINWREAERNIKK